MIRWNLATAEDGSESITALIDGEWNVAEQDHPNYREIREFLISDLASSAANVDPGDEETQQEHEDTIRDLFDVSFKIGQKFERYSDRVTVSGGRVYFDGVEVDNSLTQHVLRFVSAGVDDWKPLVNFWEKIATNPSEHSQQFVYDWLQGNQFTIADDGDIIAYKSVRPDYTSVTAGPAIVNGEWMDGNVPNNVGNVIELPRDQVAFDPAQTCSFGLHAATFEFAKHFTHGPIMKLKINPRDIVSVPVDANGDKMRVCRYVVVEEVERPVEEPIEYYGGHYGITDETTEELDEEDYEEAELNEIAAGIVAETETFLDKMKKRFGLS